MTAALAPSLTLTPHPAPYSKTVLARLADLIPAGSLVLDPFAGIGRLATIRGITAVCGELEWEWVEQTPWAGLAIQQDSRALPYRAASFPVIATSPAYGNRMADRYAGDAKGSRRHTYRIALGRSLHPNNAAAVQWGEEYRALHGEVWGECVRVLVPGGLFLLNISDHIRAKKRVPVARWHTETLVGLGLRPCGVEQVTTPRMRHGENHEARVENELILLFRKVVPE